ncbi:hypothetical protein Nepgr_015022 [Nepenthes gracilis]|uniref:BCAS3 domain-containing protein n=1 Tax=Nepenthes gracilis TaxID=150966 RepID=A0AAD3SMW3_NEPGR|nr:hypothetical protein Nepgr_015022 [Nepenthes gracilis]
MVSIPSGAVSAVFHCSMPHALQSGDTQMDALEHILVYSSGHLIQYELLPSMGEELNGTSRRGSASLSEMQDEELRVKSEPVQWWDVCRRADWPEREECITGITFGGKDISALVMDASDCEDNDTCGSSVLKHQESHHSYLYNAELQTSYRRMLLWQNYKMHFYSSSLVVRMFSGDSTDGEIEIEKVHLHEVEIKQKDLLPVFERSYSVQSDGSDRSSALGEYLDSHSKIQTTKEKPSKDAIFTPSKLLSPDPDKNSKHGASMSTMVLLDSNPLHMVNGYLPVGPTLSENNGKRGYSTLASPSLILASPKDHNVSTSMYNSAMNISPSENGYHVSSRNDTHSAERAMPKEVRSSNSVGTSEASNVSSNRSDFSMNLVDEGSVQDTLDFGQYFQEEYCKAAPLDECHDVAEVITDVDSSNSPCDREKSEEEGESDEMLGGVFAFSEEG